MSYELAKALLAGISLSGLLSSSRLSALRRRQTISISVAEQRALLEVKSAIKTDLLLERVYFSSQRHSAQLAGPLDSYVEKYLIEPFTSAFTGPAAITRRQTNALFKSLASDDSVAAERRAELGVSQAAQESIADRYYTTPVQFSYLVALYAEHGGVPRLVDDAHGWSAKHGGTPPHRQERISRREQIAHDLAGLATFLTSSVERLSSVSHVALAEPDLERAAELWSALADDIALYAGIARALLNNTFHVLLGSSPPMADGDQLLESYLGEVERFWNGISAGLDDIHQDIAAYIPKLRSTSAQGARVIENAMHAYGVALEQSAIWGEQGYVASASSRDLGAIA